MCGVCLDLSVVGSGFDAVADVLEFGGFGFWVGLEWWFGFMVFGCDWFGCALLCVYLLFVRLCVVRLLLCRLLISVGG